MYSLGEMCERFFNSDIEREKQDVDSLRRVLRRFCETGKKEDAFSVYYCYCEIFEIFGSGYDTMSKLLEFLSDHEYHSGELLTKHRDHYSHSVYVFALGLAIYANDKSFKKIFGDFYGFEKSDVSFLYLFGLCALFHDIGYPFQLAHEQLKAYVEELYGKNNEDVPFVSFDNMKWLLSIEDSDGNDSPKNVEDLLVEGINRRLGYPTDVLDKVVRNRYANQRKFLDHGYFSALLLAKRFSRMEVTEPIIDVLTAIALHNSLNRFDVKKELGVSTAISANKHPLAYLLVLCDELQNFDRTAFGYVSKKDPLAWKIYMDIEDKINVNYVFDSYMVADTLSKNGKVSSFNRKNANLIKIEDGSFVESLRELLIPHIGIDVTASEEKKEKVCRAIISSEKFVNLCDFAKAIHASYQSLYGGEDFEQLSLEFKLSNIEQAKSYAEKLELVNCFYSDKELDYPVVTDFEKIGKNSLGFLAREEHLRWVKEKLSSGWRYGVDYKDSKERNAKKIHKDIIPFDYLSKEDQEKDEIPIKNMVPLLYEYGHGVRIYYYKVPLKPLLNVAGFGHRTISSDEKELKSKIKAILKEYQKDYRVVVRSNFAMGADLLIVECAVELGITVKAVLPFDYEEHIEKIKEDSITQGYKFDNQDELRLRHLLAFAVTCKTIRGKAYCYADAANYILKKSNVAIALFDGKELPLKDEKGNPENQGGTWYNIRYAFDVLGYKEENMKIIPCKR